MRRITFCMLVLAAIVAIALPIEAQEKRPEEPRGDEINLGLIFNTGDLLLGLESYQAGVGLKIGSDALAFRVLLDIFYSNSKSSFSTDLGVCLEWHFLQQPVSPYFGGFMSLGFATQSFDTTVLYNVPISAGPVFGVELMIFDFFSIFAEYELKFSLDLNTTKGALTSDTNYTFILNTAIGNGAKLGVIFYFSRVNSDLAIIKR